MKGFEQRKRIEPEGAVRADRADVVVGVLVTQAGARPVRSEFTRAPSGGAQSFQRFVDHPVHATPGRAEGARDYSRVRWGGCLTGRTDEPPERLIRTAVAVLTHEAVQVTGDGTALVPFQLAWNPNVVDAPAPTEPL